MTLDELPNRVLFTFPECCKLLGVGLKLKKSEVGAIIAFAGFLGPFQTDANEAQLIAALTTAKTKRWTEITIRRLETGMTSYRELDKLIGKIRIPKTFIVGKFEHSHIRSLRR